MTGAGGRGPGPRPPLLVCLPAPCFPKLLPSPPGVGLGCHPRPGPLPARRSRKPAGHGFPGAAAEEVGRRRGRGAPMPPGRRPAQRQVGGRVGRAAARGGGRRALEEPAPAPAPPGEKPAQRAPGESSPTQPGAASRRAGVCTALCCAKAKAKAALPPARATSRRAAPRRSSAGPLPGMVSGPAGWAAAPGRGASPAINSCCAGAAGWCQRFVTA